MATIAPYEGEKIDKHVCRPESANCCTSHTSAAGIKRKKQFTKAGRVINLPALNFAADDGKRTLDVACDMGEQRDDGAQTL
jgi:hypothetical protein